MNAPSVVVRRLFAAFALSMACALTVTLAAQIPTRNVNMVSGLVWPLGDPFMQRQNEPSVAASTRNPMHVLAGSNDYRSVDLPLFLSDIDAEVGDAWLGLYKSTDGGERWTSTLLPGYPFDHSPEGLASPISGYHAAADPVVRSGTNGLMYYAGLAFDRTLPTQPPGKSAIFVARFIDNNNQESGDPFRYINTSLVTTSPGGATGVFLDKPWMAVDIPRQGGGTCAITTQREDGPFTQRLPAGNVYVAFTVKSVDAQGDRWDLYFSRSADCGERFSAPMRISRQEDRVNQGATIVIAPTTGEVLIAWRRIDLAPDGEEDHAIVVAKSADQGNKWNPPGVARRFPRGKKVGLDPTHFENKGKKKNTIVSQTNVTTELTPFDQGSSASGLAFRTNAYPTMTADGSGRFYLAWTERRLANDPARPELTDGDARIHLSTSADGVTWSAPIVVADVGQLGHQIMPALSFAGGKLMVAYYDLQEDRSAVFTKHVDDATAFFKTSPDRRHTIDIRASMGTPGPLPVFEHSRSVSSYMMGTPQGSTEPPKQLQVNAPNLPLFKLGTTPFIGDYIDIAPSPSFVPNGAGGWVYNTAASSTPPVFHVAWTDNRDVKPPFDGNWTKYTPPTYNGPRPPHGQAVEVCQPGWAGGRNQNIYTARVTGGLIVGSPGNSKPLNTQFARAFVVFARNTTETLAPRVFRMRILNQPPGGRASFSQFPAPPFTPTSDPPVAYVDVTVPRLSTASRTVYVTSSDPHAPVTVDVSEIGSIGAENEIPGGLEGTIYLNLDVSNPEVDNPEVDNPEVDNPEVDNAEVYNPEVDNPEVDNPEVDNPEVDNPEVDNPEVDNIVVGNPEVDNPEVDNPEVDNPEVDNPEVDNPEVDNGALIADGGVVTDITWKVKNIGNTTTAYNVNLFLRRNSLPSTGTAQLLIYRIYKTPTIKFASCDVQTTTQNVLVVNIPSPTLVLPNGEPSEPNDSDENHATVWIEPGKEVRVTVRVSDPIAADNVIINGASIDPEWVPELDVSLVLQAQPVNTPEIPLGVTEPPLVVADPVPSLTVTSAANAGPGSLREAMTMANAQPGVNTIAFNLPGAGPHTIALATLLPTQDEAVIIDGSTQPGYAGAPVIVIDGSAIAGGGAGFRLRGGSSLIRGLVIGGFGDHGIWMDSNANEAYGNYIGVDVTGTAQLSNGTSGVPINGTNNILGSPAPADRNVISGNAFSGVVVDGSNNTIAGNYIGTNAAGTAAIPQLIGVALATGGSNVVNGNLISGNAQNGVSITSAANTISLNRIGTNAAGTAAVPNEAHGVYIISAIENRVINNQISGNDSDGIFVQRVSADPTGTLIQGNLIGTDLTGAAPIPNNSGVRLHGTSNVTIGGTTAATRNVISGNVVDGVNLQDNLIAPNTQPTNNTISGNYIGINAAGTAAIGNGFVGVSLHNASNNTIGGDLPGAANVISGNVAGGVRIGASTTSNANVIIGNRIGTNPAGLVAIGNGGSGVAMVPSAGGVVTGTLIGGAGTDGNIIGGNAFAGINILGTTTGNAALNRVFGNSIGVGADGTTPIGNGSGVRVMGDNNHIGDVGMGNLISGNTGQGIMVGGWSNLIEANRIGTNASGTAAIPNGIGITIENRADVIVDAVIGGAGAGEGNLISGNTGPGIAMGQQLVNPDLLNPEPGNGPPWFTDVKGNLIGTAANGVDPLPNGAGITATVESLGVVGGPTAAARNVIAHNGLFGVVIDDNARVTLEGNSIHTNGGVDIDLGNDGVTPNDGLDADAGPNLLQNYPVVTTASKNPATGVTIVSGNLHSAAGGPFTIQLFLTQTCDPSGFGPGQTLQDTFGIVTNAAGDGIFNTVLTGLPTGWFLTATATDNAGNTSEFSQCRQVVEP
jgi:parallel beta-helix repeat protein